MDVQRRVRLCRMIEKMNRQVLYSRRLHLENETTFRGQSCTGKGGER